MPITGTQKEIIREALARACYDADEKMFEAFTLTALTGRPRSMDPSSYLAQRVARELATSATASSARYYKSDASATPQRMALEDLLADAIAQTSYKFRASLGSTARAAKADTISETFHCMRVVLRYRAPPA
jgi:hypothetical protein